MEGVGAHLVGRRCTGVRRTEARQVALVHVRALLLHAGVVARGPADAEVAVLPIQVEGRADAEVAAPAGALLHRRGRGVVVALLQVVGVGGVPVDGELAERGFRQAVTHVDVIAGGFAETGIDQRAVQAVDLAVAATGEAATGGVRTLHIALLENAVGGLGDDGVVDADLPPVEADIQAGHEVRAVHQANGPGLGGFRLQRRVGTRVEVDGRLLARLGGNGAIAVELAEVGRHLQRLATGSNGRAGGRGTERGIARIGERIAGADGTAVQVIHGGRTEAGAIGCADQQAVDRLPLQAELAVGGRAEVVVIRVATGHVQRQFARERQIGQQWHLQLQVDLVERVVATGGLAGGAGNLTLLHPHVRGVAGFFAAVLEAHRAHDVAGRQGEQRTGDVGAGHLGGALHLVDEAGEQVVLYVLVAQRARAGITHRRSRVPRHAAGDHRTRCAAAGHVAIHEGRADGLVDVRLVHAAGTDALAFIAVVHVADVPVPVPRTGFEAAFQADAGALGLQIVLGAARQLLGAVREQHILAPQVERAVLGQRGTAAVARLGGADRVRVAG